MSIEAVPEAVRGLTDHMWTIYKTTTFESAHQLDGHPKCGKLHGHSYKLEVWADSNELEEEYGFVMDFHWISDIAKEYDHSDIVIQISCEELALDISQRIMEKVREHNITLKRLKVRVWETATSYAEYTS